MSTISSKNLKGATELTVLAKIKPGLVETPDPMSYSTRLERLLDVLYQQRKKSVEVGSSGFVGPLELLRGLHFVHWSIIDQGTRLLLTVSFDKPWEPYIRSIVDDAGPILDVIFFHCEGYERATTRHGHTAFAQWVRDRQQTTNFFFADYPEMTVDDIRYQEKLKSLHDGQNPQQAPLAAFPLEARVLPPKPLDDRAQLLSTVMGLYRLKSSYPDSGDVQAANDGDVNYSDLAIYNRAVQLIVQGFWSKPLATDFKQLPAALSVAYNDIQDWYTKVVGEPAPVLPLRSERPPATEIQANILGSYGRMYEGCAVLVKIREPHKFLSFLLERVTTEARADAHQIKCNVAFSFGGLKSLGLSQAELDAFSVEFRDGMAGRAGAVGDVASNHPSRWRLPERYLVPDRGRVALETIDALLMLQTAEHSTDGTGNLPEPLQKAVEELEAAGAEILHVQRLHRDPDPKRWNGENYREHFGYLDGVSQPAPVPAPNLTAGQYNNEVTLGEVLVGYPNDHADTPSAFSQTALMKNGSFLIVRKLAQDVKAFESFVERSAGQLGKTPSEVKGLLMGRAPDGVPLATGSPQAPAANGFDYSADNGSGGCPFQAHVRLANPRTPTSLSVHGRPKRIPRLARRGFSYGPRYAAGGAPAERGLLFMAYGANIAEQYEVVQSWLNGGNSTGLASTQNDPLTGASDANRAPFRFKDATGNVRALEPKAPPFVNLEWGMYLFAPSINGLMRLREVAAHPAGPLDGLLPAGGLILQTLLNADNPLAWKKILEGQGERDKALALWAAIRERGGVLKTSYGVLVGTKGYALEVLKDESRFSAREYWLRMKASSLPMHLGMDKQPLAKAVCPMRGGVAPDQAYVDDIGRGSIDYTIESLANPELFAIQRYDAFKRAYGITRTVLDQSAPSAETPTRKLADLFIVGERVIATLSRLWFGLPDGELMKLGGQPLNANDSVAYCPADFTFAAQYIFRPNPDPWAIELAKLRGARIQAAAKAAVDAQIKSGKLHPFIAGLMERAHVTRKGEPRELVVRSVVGAVDGFVAAAWGSFVTTIGQWVKNGDLLPVRLACEDDILTLASAAQADQEEDEARADGVDFSNACSLVQRIFKALMILPVPPWLHRTALERTQLGGVPIEPGDRIVVNLSSAALDGYAQTLRAEGAHALADPLLLFGGAYSTYDKGSGPDETPRHACPAQEAAIGVLLGMMVGVLERKSIRAEGPLVLSFDA